MQGYMNRRHMLKECNARQLAYRTDPEMYLTTIYETVSWHDLNKQKLELPFQAVLVSPFAAWW